VGGLAWARRTQGRLTGAERRRLVLAVARGQVENAVGRAKLALGSLPPGARDVDVGSFVAPDSPLARAAEEACADQPAAVSAHCYRTWLFGRAVAVVDRVELDPELFYCAALVHDYGISPPVAGRDFTLGGADRALGCAAEAGLPAEIGEQMADAICVHTTPGVSVERDGPLGCYVQWGAMVDAAGLRLWDITKENVRTVLEAHPRGAGFKREFAGLMRAEADAVPGGRSRCSSPVGCRSPCGWHPSTTSRDA
jgi:hypothetical protein